MTKPHEARIDASVLIPFLIFTLVWSSTWIVIRDQLGVVPPQWSVAYRFLLASVGMAGVALWHRQSLKPSKAMLGAAAILGASQFALNFNSVYLAERFITSGVVATVFATLLIPNSLLAWAWLGQKPSARFAAGGALAVVGVGLLFTHEMRASSASAGEVVTGLAFTLLGLLGASIANVYQARPKLFDLPLYSLLAWSMALGAMLDVVLALGIAGPPVFDPRPGYVAGLVYLAIAASVLCFSLYFPVVRKIGPGRAAYSSVLVPIIAMALSTLFEGYRWSPMAVVGGITVLAGMLVALGGGRRRMVAAPDAG